MAQGGGFGIGLVVERENNFRHLRLNTIDFWDQFENLIFNLGNFRFQRFAW